MEKTKAYAQLSAALAISSMTTAAAITLAGSYTLSTFGEIWLTIGMNFLSLPLLLAGFMGVDLWVWYIVVLMWSGHVSVIITFYPD